MPQPRKPKMSLIRPEVMAHLAHIAEIEAASAGAKLSGTTSTDIAPGGKGVSWLDLFQVEMKKVGESWDDIEECTMTDDEIHDGMLAATEGYQDPICAWSRNHVYLGIVLKDGGMNLQTRPRREIMDQWDPRALRDPQQIEMLLKHSEKRHRMLE